jgi:hypothetical protein
VESQLLVPPIKNGESSLLPSLHSSAMPPIKRKTGSKQTAGAVTISLTGTDARRSFSSRSSTRKGSDVTWGTKWATPDSTSSAHYIQVARQVARLCHVSPGEVAMYAHSCGSLFPLAVERLLADLERKRPFNDDLESSAVALVQLHEVFPKKPVQLYKQLLCATLGSVEDAIELSFMLEDSSESDGAPVGHPLKVASITNSEATTSDLEEDSGGTFTLVTKRKRARSASPPGGSCESVVVRSAEECASLAKEFRKKRDEADKRARQFSRTNKSSRGTEGAAFSYYTQKVREYDRQSQYWEFKAAMALVNSNRR